LPRGAGAVAAALKANVHPVPGGHFLMQEQPERVLDAMRSTLA
jgi:surfactin synthase thioesterase subunit